MIFGIFLFLVFAAWVIFSIFVVINEPWRKAEEAFFLSFATILVFFLTIPWGLSWTTGFRPDYDKYTDEVEIISVEKKGSVYRTWEVEYILRKNGNVSIENASTNDNDIAEKLQSLVNQSTRISIEEWLIMPYRMGFSNRDIVSIEE